jgi:hypothetical protein
VKEEQRLFQCPKGVLDAKTTPLVVVGREGGRAIHGWIVAERPGPSPDSKWSSDERPAGR